MYKVIQVEFDSSSKGYSYFCDIEDIDVGDYVIVWARSELKLVVVSKVQGLSRNAIGRASSLIVQKVDLEGYADRNTKLELMQEIKNELRSAKEQQDEWEIYKVMAKTNPNIKILLEKLGKLDPSMIPLLEE
jgi:hypothetical protein